MTKTAAILSSGGDAPGINAAVWAATAQLELSGWRALGVQNGFAGLLRGEFIELQAAQTLRHARLGGSFLGTSRVSDFASQIRTAAQQLERAGVSHLLVLGGNGSLRGAAALEQAGVRVVGLPATIDNDVAGSEDSLGFDSAVTLGLFLLDAFRDTLEALPRLGALETLGGDTGFLAERIGRVGGADAILVPEQPLTADELEASVRRGLTRQGFALVVASEGYPELEGVLRHLETRLGGRLRFSRPSHAMRGGRPSAHDRHLALKLGQAGADALVSDQTGLIAWRGGRTVRLGFRDLPEVKPFSPEQN